MNGNIDLNLLAPTKKTKFLKLVRFIFVKEFLEVIILTTSVLAITHLIGWLILIQGLNNLAESTLIVNRENSTINQEVRRINSITKNVIAAGDQFALLTPKIAELFTTLPSTIKLSAFSIDRTTNSVKIIGTATTRDALLDFNKYFDSISWLTNVTKPTSQLFQKEDVPFEITAQLKGFTALKKQPAVRRPAPKSAD